MSKLWFPCPGLCVLRDSREVLFILHLESESLSARWLDRLWDSLTQEENGGRGILHTSGVNELFRNNNTHIQKIPG